MPEIFQKGIPIRLTYYWRSKTKPVAQVPHNIDKRALCSKLVKAREAAKLTQGDVEKRLGISQSELSKIENGQRKIEFLTVAKLAKLYGVEISFFAPTA